MKDEVISAFAYNTAKEIEHIVTKRTDELEEHNRRLEGLILSYRQKITDPQELVRFDTHFYITTQ